MTNQELPTPQVSASLEERIAILEQDVQNLKAESQYVNLTIKAIGTDVIYENCSISCGKQTKKFSDGTIKSGTSDNAEWRGKSGAWVGAEITANFKIDDNNNFAYYGLSPWSGENQSELRLDGVKDKEKYEVSFEQEGNISHDGALGFVIVRVKKLKQ